MTDTQSRITRHVARTPRGPDREERPAEEIEPDPPDGRSLEELGNEIAALASLIDDGSRHLAELEERLAILRARGTEGRDPSLQSETRMADGRRPVDSYTTIDEIGV